MAGSTFGNILRCTTWGESHGEAIGVVIDGIPAGIPLKEDDIQCYLNRRKPGSTQYSTPRKEDDSVEILSGLMNHVTTGTPISIIVRNQSQHSSDYDNIKDCYRPGHADYSFDAKYGIRDYRGGGRSSGRETIGRVAAGAVAFALLRELGIEIHAYTRSIGSVMIPDIFDYNVALKTPTAMPDLAADEKACELLKECMMNHDSVGGCIECVALNVPAGIGEPVFDKLDATLAQAIMSIGAVKAVEIGDGIKVSTMYGSENNDSFQAIDGCVTTKTNHCGGILGGISNGNTICIRAHVKPTPSIFQEQDTINTNLESVTLQIKGRHDPVIVPRAVVVVECMTAFTIADLLLQNMSSKLDSVKKVYGRL